MAKKKETIFKCSSCGYSQPRWLGHCPQCGEWNSLEECVVENVARLPGARSEVAKPIPLSCVSPQEGERILTEISEFDRVLGGGAMRRSAILIGGEPGIGKSTLLLQSCAAISEKTKARVLYVSGEESAAQIRARADRLRVKTDKIEILCTTHLSDIEAALSNVNPVFCVVDSIQTVFSEEAGVVPGTVGQLKLCANELVGWVKARDSVLVMSAHITKDGLIAGPKSLEHLVDTVISFERNDDEIRFLRASKNRFGSVDELGIFAMSEKGLECVGEPSAMFITKREGESPAGIANTCVFEGSRAFVVEIQALTVPAKSSMSRVYSDKIDSSRVARVAAVLEKRTGLKFSEMDLYINVAGGARLKESAIDAALAAALYSARTDIPVKSTSVILGELSLAGEIRPVARLKSRIKTARDMGFKTVLAPEKDDGATRVSSVKELLSEIFEK